MKKIVTAAVVVAVAFNLSSCTNTSNQDVGAVSGMVVGGLLGSQFGHGGGQALATGAGMLAGAYIGASIGKNMDDNDRLRMNQALETSKIGQPVYWQNQNTGNSYTFVPTRNVTFDGNPYCREYRTTANIAGKKQQLYGTACRQPDGSWRMES